MNVAETITDGSLLLAVPLAVVAGVVSFLSPCVLPLVPGYLSYVTGLSAAEVFDEAPRRRGRLAGVGRGVRVGWLDADHAHGAKCDRPRPDGR